VIVNAEEIRIIVFNNGISYGLNGVIPLGNHNWPISRPILAGDNEA